MSERQQYWSAHLDRIAAEGISTRAYARREGLSATTLYYWRRRLKAEATDVSAPAAEPAGRSLVPVEIIDEAAVGAGPCTLTLAPGIELALSELPSPEWLARVVTRTSDPS